MNGETTKINLFFPKDLLEVLKGLAAKQDVPYSQLIRDACRTYAVEQAPRILERARALEELRK